MMSLPSSRTVLAVALLLLVAAPAAAAPGGGSGGPDEACGVLSTSGAASPDDAQTTLAGLEQAADLPLPKKVKKAIKTLIPLYESLASGKGGKALDRLATYIDEECAADADGGTSGAEGEDATGVDACALVTLEDAQTLAGTPLDPGMAAPPENPTATCTYTGPVTGPTAQVEIFAGPGAKKALDIDRDLGHVLTPVAGLGDEAYAEENNIFWLQDGVWYQIRLVLLNEPAQNVAPLETLARKVSAAL
jgi:hypothetical protein